MPQQITKGGNLYEAGYRSYAAIRREAGYRCPMRNFGLGTDRGLHFCGNRQLGYDACRGLGDPCGNPSVPLRT